MSVRPTNFDDKVLSVWHDELGHGGTIALIDLQFTVDRSLGNREVIGTIGLTCPVCGIVSVHPIGGGADRVNVQRIFAVLLFRRVGKVLAAVKALIAGALGPDDSWIVSDDDMAALRDGIVLPPVKPPRFPAAAQDNPRG